MAILPPPRLLLHQVHLSLRTQINLHRLHRHPRPSLQTLLSPKAMTPRLRLRLPRIRLQLLPRTSHLLRRLLLPKPVGVGVVAMCTREASTYLGVCSF